MPTFHYCARCLAAAEPALEECCACAARFTGSGRFDLISGPPPSPAFAFLFRKPEPSGNSPTTTQVD